MHPALFSGNSRSHAKCRRETRHQRPSPVFFSDHTKLLLPAAALAAVLYLAAAPAYAEYRMEPAISVSEEYNDNIFLEPNDPDSDYITRFVPSFRLSYGTAFWDWEVSYAYDYRYFARHAIDQDDTHSLNLLNHTRIMDDFLSLDITDTYRRVSLYPARDFTEESFFVNQSDSNIFTASPYLTIRASSTDTITMGYLFVSTWYKASSAIDKIDNVVYILTAHELTSRLSFSTGYRYTDEQNDAEDYTKNDIYVFGIYEYTDGGTLAVTLGNSWFDFDTRESTTQVFWDGTIVHRLPTVSFSFLAALNYRDDPQGTLIREDRYVATVAKETERTNISASLGLREYRSAKTKHLTSSVYFGTGTLSHALTTQTRIIGTLTVERLADERRNMYTSRYLPALHLEHELLTNVTLAVHYRYTNIYSQDIYENNYQNNRVTAEIRASF